MKAEYDLLRWTSFPSSMKLVNDGTANYVVEHIAKFPVDPAEGEISIECNMKLEGLGFSYASHIPIHTFDGTAWKMWQPIFSHVGFGTWDWKKMIDRKPGFRLLPSNTRMLRVSLAGGAGTKETPAKTWFDDLRIYQDDVLIYENKFSNWAPVIIPAEIITGAAMIKYIK